MLRSWQQPIKRRSSFLFLEVLLHQLTCSSICLLTMSILKANFDSSVLMSVASLDCADSIMTVVEYLFASKSSAKKVS
jgi:hypothetical protein